MTAALATEYTRGASVAFTVHGCPVPKARAGRNGGRSFTTAATRKYERAIAWAATDAISCRGAWPRNAAYRLEVAMYFPDARRRDADNVLKSICDAGNKLLWRDDTQVIETATLKRIDRDMPRIDVRVYVLEPSP